MKLILKIILIQSIILGAIDDQGNYIKLNRVDSQKVKELVNKKYKKI